MEDTGTIKSASRFGSMLPEGLQEKGKDPDKSPERGIEPSLPLLIALPNLILKATSWWAGLLLRALFGGGFLPHSTLRAV